MVIRGERNKKGRVKTQAECEKKYLNLGEHKNTYYMQSTEIFLDSPQGKIPCIVYLPNGYDATKKAYCIVALHGSGETGDDTKAGLDKLLANTNFQNLLTDGDKYGFVIIAPQLVLQIEGWVPAWLPWYTDVAVQYALDNYSAYTQVGLFGLSLGGNGEVQFITTSDAYISKINCAVICCPAPQYTGDFSLVKKHSLPVWFFHAKDDTTIPVIASQNMVRMFNAFNPIPAVKYTEYATGNHFIWGQVEGDQSVWDWVSAQPKTPAATVLVPLSPSKQIKQVVTLYNDGTYDLK